MRTDGPAWHAMPARWPRRLGLLTLVLTVSIAHWWLAEQLPDRRFGLGAADGDLPEAIDVAFVRELVPTAPPVHAAPAPPPRVPAAARPLRPAASAASAVADVGAETQASAADAAANERPASPAEPAASAAATLLAAASAPAADASAAAPVPAPPSAPAPALAFDWPPSTRLSYIFEGYSMGPVFGNAKVEWLREGSRYQVRLEVRVPPLGGRRMLSDGVLGPQGLAPRRYDEETDRLFRETARQTVLFEADRIQLADGRVNDTVPGVQDTASQFVQMTWLFLARPELLQVGRTVEFPLALPRRVGRWTYDVREQVELTLPFGVVPAFHLEPRPQSRRGREWLVDIWIAPSLQYLPAKITLRQDADNYGELVLKSPPLQAAAAAPAASSPGRIVR